LFVSLALGQDAADNLTGVTGNGKLNILFITTDQQRTSTLKSYGNDFAHSPNIDRLASQGVRFTDAHTVSPVCSPSRTSILTGVHVPIHGVYENGVLPHRLGLTPYFRPLKKRGYHTALIGKTHFNPVPRLVIDHLDMHSGNKDRRGPNQPYSEFLETYLVNKTMDWIDSVTATAGTAVGRVDSSKPWFVHLSMVSPHPPNWVPPGPWAHIYDNVALPPLNWQDGSISRLPYQTRMLLNLLGKEADDPPAFPSGRPNMSYIDQCVRVGADYPDGRLNYYAQAAYVDHEVGRILYFLELRGLANNTLVIFTSDHGTQLFDHGIGNDKHNFFDASLRVPLIMRLPGVLPAGATREFATTLDVTATILAAAGADIPADYQGFDLLAPIAAGRASPRTAAVASEYRASAVVTHSWKLAFFPEQNEGRLWNRAEDPKEENDLFTCKDGFVSEVRNGLLLALLRWRAQQDPLGYLQAHSFGGAPTATAATNHTRHLRGIDAELALQEDVMQLERRWSGATGIVV